MVAVFAMTGAVHLAAGTKALTVGKIRLGAGLKTLVAGHKRTSDGLKQIYASIQVALSTYSALGRGNSAATLPVSSDPVTATVTGAIGTVSHAWSRTDGGAQPWTIDSPTSATTTFTTNCAQGTDFTATFIDTVTDQAGQVLASSPVTVDCANIYYGGGYLGDSPPPPGSAYP
jgi:hypothetical protein